MTFNLFLLGVGEGDRVTIAKITWHPAVLFCITLLTERGAVCGTCSKCHRPLRRIVPREKQFNLDRRPLYFAS